MGVSIVLLPASVLNLLAKFSGFIDLDQKKPLRVCPLDADDALPGCLLQFSDAFGVSGAKPSGTPGGIIVPAVSLISRLEHPVAYSWRSACKEPSFCALPANVSPMI
jgi:hypothetical protein